MEPILVLVRQLREQVRSLSCQLEGDVLFEVHRELLEVIRDFERILGPVKSAVGLGLFARADMFRLQARTCSLPYPNTCSPPSLSS